MRTSMLNMEGTGIDTKIYRIYDRFKFEELIIRQLLSLKNPELWGDPFENFFLRKNAYDSDNNNVDLSRISGNWYGQCWSLNIESDAMWRIYSPLKDGVKVSTTINKLFSAVCDNKHNKSISTIIGKVEYKTRTEIENTRNYSSFVDLAINDQPDGFAKMLLIKRKEFEHEKEVRLLIYNRARRGGEKGYYGILQFNYNSIFEDICLDPRLTSGEFNVRKQVFERLGCKVPIVQSEMYKTDFRPIRMV